MAAREFLFRPPAYRYTDNQYDTEMVDVMYEQVFKIINKLGSASLEDIADQVEALVRLCSAAQCSPASHVTSIVLASIVLARISPAAGVQRELQGL